MNSTTTPTLRQLAVAAYAEKIERDTAARLKEKDAYRFNQNHRFNLAAARALGIAFAPDAMAWNETDQQPEASHDGLKFVPVYYDNDSTSIDGVALQLPDGRRHRIESLADLGALLQDQEIAADNAVWNLQRPKNCERCGKLGTDIQSDRASLCQKCFTDDLAAELQEFAPENLPLAPPMSETHPEPIQRLPLNSDERDLQAIEERIYSNVCNVNAVTTKEENDELFRLRRKTGKSWNPSVRYFEPWEDETE